MKNIKIKGLALLLSLFTLTGCDFMDCDESDNYTKEDVLGAAWSGYANVAYRQL